MIYIVMATPIKKVSYSFYKYYMAFSSKIIICQKTTIFGYNAHHFPILASHPILDIGPYKVPVCLIPKCSSILALLDIAEVQSSNHSSEMILCGHQPMYHKAPAGKIGPNIIVIVGGSCVLTVIILNIRNATLTLW